MSKYEQQQYEAAKGSVITKKNGRYYYRSLFAGRVLPLKKIIAEALLAENACELEVA